MKRIVDRELLNTYHNEPCVRCNRTEGSCAHHLKTKGSGGDDVEANLITVCQVHHNEFHNKGLNYMADSYRAVEIYLLKYKWLKDDFSGKWLPLTPKGYDD